MMASGNTRKQNMKNHIMARTLALAAGLMMSFIGVSQIQAGSTNGFAYVINGTGVTITNCTLTDAILEIPQSIEGLPVTSIDTSAFWGLDRLASVFIPVTVTNIGVAAFADRMSLTNISVDSSNPCYSSVDGVLFNKTQTILIQCPARKPGYYYKIPTGTACIGESAFMGCAKFTSIIIPDGVTNIGEGAFDSCYRLNSIILPEGIAQIGRYTFNRCANLPRITIPNSVTNIGYSAFYECYSLISVFIGKNLAIIGNRAFMNCTELTTFCFTGDAPIVSPSSFYEDKRATVFYLEGTSGWTNTLGGRPTQLFNNHLPALAQPIPDQTIALESTFSYTIPADAFTDPDQSQTLSYQASGLPFCLSVDAASRTISGPISTGGQFPIFVGHYPITIIATDNGTPAMSAWAQFTLTIKPANSGPTLRTLSDLTTDEHSPLVVTNTASDADLPARLLSYTLLSAPEGAAIDSDGIITWIPSESQGGTTNILVTVVTDNGSPALSATNSFSVVVNESNSSPQLAALQDYTVNPGQQISFASLATDSDIPTNTLTFSLTTPINGAVIDPATGFFTWRPSVAQAGSTNRIEIQVADDGSPSLFDTKSFSVVVNPMGSIKILPLGYSEGRLTLEVQGTAGPDFVILTSENLVDWTPFFTNKSANASWQYTDPEPPTTQRFYRVTAQ